MKERIWSNSLLLEIIISSYDNMLVHIYAASLSSIMIYNIHLGIYSSLMTKE